MKTRLDETNKMRRLMGLSLINEAVSAPEPVLGWGTSFYQDGLPLGSAEVDERKEMIFNHAASNMIKNSNDTIGEFNSLDSKFKLPQFIEIKVGTDATGGEKENVKTYNKRKDKAIQMVKDAFEDSGIGLNATQIEKFIAPIASYQPTELDRNTYDSTKVGNRPKERFISIKINSLDTVGRDIDDITAIEDYIEYWRGDNWNPGEEEIAGGICLLRTYSDIQDLDKRLISPFGGLENFINTSITGTGNIIGDENERRQIIGCLNKASNRSGVGDVVQSAGDKITIDLDRVDPKRKK